MRGRASHRGRGVPAPGPHAACPACPPSPAAACQSGHRPSGHRHPPAARAAAAPPSCRPHGCPADPPSCRPRGCRGDPPSCRPHGRRGDPPSRRLPYRGAAAARRHAPATAHAGRPQLRCTAQCPGARGCCRRGRRRTSCRPQPAPPQSLTTGRGARPAQSGRGPRHAPAGPRSGPPCCPCHRGRHGHAARAAPPPDPPSWWVLPVGAPAGPAPCAPHPPPQAPGQPPTAGQEEQGRQEVGTPDVARCCC